MKDFPNFDRLEYKPKRLIIPAYGRRRGNNKMHDWMRTMMFLKQELGTDESGEDSRKELYETMCLRQIAFDEDQLADFHNLLSKKKRKAEIAAD